MKVLALATGTYLYLSFLGWGLSRIVLPRTLHQYRAWFAPWIGMMLAAVLGVRLSRWGIGVGAAAYAITIIAAGLAACSVLLKPGPPRRSTSRVPFGLACLVTLALALYPLLYLRNGPTTVSLGNCDPAFYAATAQFLRHGSLLRPPDCDVTRPLTCLINSIMGIRHFPGAFIIISLFATVFHVQTYEIFTVLLAVVLSLTTPLVGVFVRVVSGSRVAAMVALVTSALSVNQLYFFYHGFAGQIFGQGGLIIAFTLLWKAESDQKQWLSYAFMLGLTVCAMLELYQEDVVLFLVPCGFYLILQLLTAKTTRWPLVCRYALPIGIVFLLDPLAFWYCLVFLWSVRAAVAGWPMPRWALPADMVGLTNVYLQGNSERFAAIVSVPVVCLALWGFLCWRNPRLTLSVISVELALFLYEYGIRHSSYAYHKLAANVSFLLIGAFAMGIARGMKRVNDQAMRAYAEGSVLVFLGVICVLATAPLVEDMKRRELSVSSDLVELSEAKRIASNRPIYFAEVRWWEQLWGTYFLHPAAIVLRNPNGYFHMPTSVPEIPSALQLIVGPISGYFALPPDWQDSSANQLTLVTATPPWLTVLWRNRTYSLISAHKPLGPQRSLLRLINGGLDQWITSKGLILEVPESWVKLRPDVELSGTTMLYALLGGNVKVDAKVDLVGRSPEKVPATIKATGDHYVLVVHLNPADMHSEGVLRVRLSFDKYFVPEKVGLNSDTRQLVVLMPDSVRLIRQQAAAVGSVP